MDAVFRIELYSFAPGGRGGVTKTVERQAAFDDGEKAILAAEAFRCEAAGGRIAAGGFNMLSRASREWGAWPLLEKARLAEQFEIAVHRRDSFVVMSVVIMFDVGGNLYEWTVRDRNMDRDSEGVFRRVD